MRRLLRALVQITLVGFVIAEGARAATPPTLVGVGERNRYATATFGPLTGVTDLVVWVSSSPDRGPNGNFLPRRFLLSDSLFRREIDAASWTSDTQLDPGRYYLMAEAWSRGCVGSDCIAGYTEVLPLAIPKPAQSYRASARILRAVRLMQLQLTVTPLGERLPYRVCWTIRHGTRCIRARVAGRSWNASASSRLRVPLRDMPRVTIVTWRVSGQVVAARHLIVPV
jgi:hypothetical protein